MDLLIIEKYLLSFQPHTYGAQISYLFSILCSDGIAWIIVYVFSRCIQFLLILTNLYPLRSLLIIRTR